MIVIENTREVKQVQLEYSYSVVHQKGSSLSSSLSSSTMITHERPLIRKLLTPSFITKASSFVVDDDEECYSLTSTSYCSSSSSSLTSSYTPERDGRRRVNFSAEECNELYYVPRLYPKESLHDYFYSYEDTQRFRQESRLERKVFADLGADIVSHEGELRDLFCLTDKTEEESKNNDNSKRNRQISHVVVLHKDKLETFCNPIKQQQEQQKQSPDNINDFFDNDSFWNGSMTWH